MKSWQMVNGHMQTKKRCSNISFLLFAQHERILTGASPQAALTVGRLQPKARVSTVRWNLKEALGKHLTRRTET